MLSEEKYRLKRGVQIDEMGQGKVTMCQGIKEGF